MGRSARIYRRRPGSRRVFAASPDRVLDLKTTSPGLLFYSARGLAYSACAFRTRLAAFGIVAPTGRDGGGEELRLRPDQRVAPEQVASDDSARQERARASAYLGKSHRRLQRPCPDR